MRTVILLGLLKIAESIHQAFSPNTYFLNQTEFVVYGILLAAAIIMDVIYLLADM